MQHQTIAILDFGSQYIQLIARRVREQNVFSQICRANVPAEELKQMAVSGIILSGGPASVRDKGAPWCDEKIFKLGVPILGICYGMQLGCQILGAEVSAAQVREYGRKKLEILDKKDLFKGLPDTITVWASHGDQVGKLSSDFIRLAQTDSCPFAAVRHKKIPFYGVQFHPEVSHTPKGELILKNFLYDICGCKGDWTMSDFVAESVKKIKQKVGSSTVLCGLSGGVDSSVTASLVHKAVGKQLVSIFVDNGLLRKNERQAVVSTFHDHFGLDLRVVDWAEQFLSALKGIKDLSKSERLSAQSLSRPSNLLQKKFPMQNFSHRGRFIPM